MSESTTDSLSTSSRDPLLRMRAYRVASELVEEVWNDAEKLRHHGATEKISGQLYAAVGSIAANLGEGYSHSSGRDRARISCMRSDRHAKAWFGTRQRSRCLVPTSFATDWINSKRYAASCSQQSPVNAEG
jgi:hypothetical protein